MRLIDAHVLIQELDRLRDEQQKLGHPQVVKIKTIKRWIGRLEEQPPLDLNITPAYQSYFSAGDESEILCPACGCNLDEWDVESKPFKWCPECGQHIKTLDEMQREELLACEDCTDRCEWVVLDGESGCEKSKEDK